MPLGQASGFPQADPGGRVTPRFRHRLIRFRHFIDGLLALASLNLTRRDIVPTLTATLTTIAFDNNSLQRFEGCTLTAGLEGPPFISRTVGRRCTRTALVTHGTTRRFAAAHQYRST